MVRDQDADATARARLQCLSAAVARIVGSSGSSTTVPPGGWNRPPRPRQTSPCRVWAIVVGRASPATTRDVSASRARFPRGGDHRPRPCSPDLEGTTRMSPVRTARGRAAISAASRLTRGVSGQPGDREQ